MTTQRNIDDVLGTRPEDWPDLDMDSDTEEYAQALALNEASFVAVMDREINQRYAKLAFDHIPKALYTKAKEHHDQLTKGETELLLSRGDVIGKALASPESLTIDEKHQVLRWPPPGTVRMNIQHATNGMLSTPKELYNKAKNAKGRGQLKEALNNDEIALLTGRFYAINDPDFGSLETMDILASPGTGPAMEVVLARMGMEWNVFEAVEEVKETQAQMVPTFPVHGAGLPCFSANHTINDIFYLLGQIERGVITAEEVTARKDEYFNALKATATFNQYHTAMPFVPNNVLRWPAMPPFSPADYYGSHPWPLTAKRYSAIDLFRDDTHLSGWDVEPGWFVVPEYQREAYRARSESLRLDAWATYNEAVAQATNRFVLPQRNNQQLRPADLGMDQSFRQEFMRVREPIIITAFMVFREDLGTDTVSQMGFQEALEMWDGLTEEQKEEYGNRAHAANAAVDAAYLEGSL